MKSCPVCQGVYPTSFTVCPKDGTALRLVSELTEGAVLRGKYQILSKLGEGGMGIVYKVRHLHFDEVRALKVVSARLTEEPGFLQRFRAEALVMRRLAHPNAVRVEDFDETEDGRLFMVMEYVEGRGLDKVIAAGQVAPRRALQITIQACSALEAAHNLGIIHRDIKPANILLSQTPDGQDWVKVLDFGVAKVKEGSLAAGASLTRTGFVVGTPEYMSPEQARGVRGAELDGRTDLYSLGVVLYEMLTGRLPFTAETPVMMLLAHVQTPPLDPRAVRADLPEPLVEVVLRALEKEPAHRFASSAAMREALENLAGDRTIRLTPAPAPSAVRDVRPPPPPPRVPPRVPPAEGRMSPPGAKQAALAAPRPARPVFAPAEEPSRSPWMYVAIGVIVLAGAAGGFLWYRSTKPVPPPAETPAPAVETPAPPATQPAAPPPASATQAPATPAPAAEETESEEVRKLLEYGRDAMRRGDREAAAGFFRGALALDPENRLAREGLRRAQRPPEPVRPAAPKIDEAAVQRFLQAGKQAMDAGRYEEAIRNFQAVLDLDPNHVQAQRGLAMARRALAAEQEVLRPR